jgi:hypothetical protein
MMFYLLTEEIVGRTELTDFTRDPYKALDDMRVLRCKHFRGA